MKFLIIIATLGQATLVVLRRRSPECACSAPQHDCACGTVTSHPASTIRRTVSRFSAGNIASITHVV